MVNRISITDAEIAAHLAEAHVRRYTKYPRCDCDGNKQLAKKWKEDAKADVCGFIKGQFGKEPRLLDATDRRAVKRDCLTYLPKEKVKQLGELKGGRPPKTFWADFCESTHKYDVLPQDKALKLFKSMFPTPKNMKAKTLSEITFSESQRKRVMADALLMVRLDLDSRRALGLMTRVSVPVSKQIQLALSPKLSLAEAETYILRKLNARAKGLAFRDPETNKIVIKSHPRKYWLQIAKDYGSLLPQSFLDAYSSDLVKKKAGKKKRVIDPTKPIVLHTSKDKTAAKKRLKLKQANLAKQAREHGNETPKNHSVDVGELSKKSVPVPGKISTPERLNSFINNVMRKHDDTYGLSTEIRHWSNPEWSMVDVYRDSITQDLLDKYSAQIEQARRVLGVRSGGAYASIRDNRQLCVAHVVTAWMCGELQ